MEPHGCSQNVAADEGAVEPGVEGAGTSSARSANDARVTTVGFRFCMEFETATSDEGWVRVILDPDLAKQLAERLSRQLYRHEHFIGPIALPATEAAASQPVERPCSVVRASRLR
ncbi:MAG: hypothetical protein P8R42_06695 [Candidatus Binatia bacterium]|nr:hypothetical protein [Candidatus Binatia bacterium]